MSDIQPSNQLNLDRDLVFLDVETTGLSVVVDRILQIGMLKIAHLTGAKTELSMLINPGIPISEASMAIHGITPKDVARKPTFAEVAQQLWDFIGDADLAGYNSNRFDVPMLMEEFARVGKTLDISRRRLIDVQRIFYKMEPRTLKAAYRLYCDAELSDAHDALADVRATHDVLLGQLQRYHGIDLLDEEGGVVENPVRNDMQVLHDFTNDLGFLDATQKLRRQPDGTVVFAFGKYQGQVVHDVFRKERHYFHWMMEKNFSSQVKQIIRGIMMEVDRDQRPT
jgi:DNA polymerase-3 subunit epsilon